MKRVLFLFLAFATSISMFAQNDVTLVVSGIGESKDDAINIALRSAIDQAFGVFVASKSEILNDELIKDEIATVSSGNIKSFKELGCNTISSGEYSVILEACVSTSKLTTYAKSKGASCDLAGATMVANIKMQQLYSSNSEKALQHLVRELELLSSSIFDYNIEITASNNNVVQLKILVCANSNTVAYIQKMTNTLIAISKNQTTGYRFNIYHPSRYTNFKSRTIDSSSIYKREFLLPCEFSSMEFHDALAKSLWSFYIVDNMNNKYYLKIGEGRWGSLDAPITVVDTPQSNTFFPYVHITPSLRTTDVYMPFQPNDFYGWALSVAGDGIVLPSLPRKMKSPVVLYEINTTVEFPMEILTQLTNLQVVVGEMSN